MIFKLSQTRRIPIAQLKANWFIIIENADGATL